MLSRVEIQNAFEQIRVRLDIRTRILASVSKIDRLSRSQQELESHLTAIQKKAVVADKQKKVKEFMDAANRCFIAIDDEKKLHKRLLKLESFVEKMIDDINTLEQEILSVENGLSQSDVNNLNLAINDLLNPRIELTENQICFFEYFWEELLIENVGKPFYLSEEEKDSFAIDKKIAPPEIKQEIPEDYNPFDDISPEAVDEALEQLMLAELSAEIKKTHLNAANKQITRNRNFPVTNYYDAFFSESPDSDDFKSPTHAAPTTELKRH